MVLLTAKASSRTSSAATLSSWARAVVLGTLRAGGTQDQEEPPDGQAYGCCHGSPQKPPEPSDGRHGPPWGPVSGPGAHLYD
jgi:hypothetical protein